MDYPQIRESLTCHQINYLFKLDKELFEWQPYHSIKKDISIRLKVLKHLEGYTVGELNFIADNDKYEVEIIESLLKNYFSD